MIKWAVITIVANLVWALFFAHALDLVKPMIVTYWLITFAMCIGGAFVERRTKRGNTK